MRTPPCCETYIEGKHLQSLVSHTALQAPSFDMARLDWPRIKKAWEKLSEDEQRVFCQHALGMELSSKAERTRVRKTRGFFALIFAAGVQSRESPLQSEHAMLEVWQSSRERRNALPEMRILQNVRFRLVHWR